MNFIGNLYNVFVFPSFIIHELCHLIFGVFVGVFPIGFEAEIRKNTPLSARISYKDKYKDAHFVNFIIGLAPLFFLVGLVTCYLIFQEKWLLYILIYMLLTLEVIFPSNLDLQIVFKSIGINKTNFGNFLFRETIEKLLFPEHVKIEKLIEYLMDENNENHDADLDIFFE